MGDCQRGELPKGEWDAVTRPLEGQTHMVKPKVVAPELVAFFSGGELESQLSPRGSRVA